MGPKMPVQLIGYVLLVNCGADPVRQRHVSLFLGAHEQPNQTILCARGGRRARGVFALSCPRRTERRRERERESVCVCVCEIGSLTPRLADEPVNAGPEKGGLMPRQDIECGVCHELMCCMCCPHAPRQPVSWRCHRLRLQLDQQW